MKKILLVVPLFLGTFILAQVDVTSTSGTVSATYTTVKSAFDAINAGTHQGTINVIITASTSESSTAILNRSTGTSNFTSLLLKPAVGVTPTITNNKTSGAVMRILANNVTIDGSNESNGNSRDLSLVNSFETGTQVLAVGSSDAANPISNVTIKNTNIINSLKNSGYGIIVSNTAGSATAGYFNNIKIENNTIQKCYYGIYFLAVSASANGSNSFITKNDLSTSGTNSNRFVGIYLGGTDGVSVTENKIGNFETSFAEAKRGMWLSVGTMNSVVNNNIIDNIGYSGSAGGSVSGIQIYTNSGAGNIASANKIAKNKISNLFTSGINGSAVGISVGGSTVGTIVSENIISNLTNTQSGPNASGAVAINLNLSTSSSATLVSNNFISKISSYADNNSTRTYTGGILIDGYGGAGYKIYNNTIVLTETLVNETRKGIPIGLSVRNITTVNGADVRNNIFVADLQDKSLSAYAIHTSANVNVFSAIDNNMYYSSKDLAASSTFSSSTVYPTLEDLKVYFGGNVNSLKFLPKFVSETDPHLSISSENELINNKGIFLADVTTDIDGQSRSTSTPDIGADEFEIESLGSDDVKISTNTVIYPNPVVNILTVASDKKIGQLSIYDINGRILQEVKNTHKIDLSKLSSGVYFLKTLIEGKEEITKFIKK